MSFLFNNSGRVPPPPARPGVQPHEQHEPDRQVSVLRQPADAERFYRELIEQRPALIEEKLKLHARIIDEFNLALLENMPHEALVRQVRAYVAGYIRAEKISLNQRELEMFTNEIIDEMTGFGPIEPLLKDPTVSDILINTHEGCFVERFGKLYEAEVRCKDEEHLLRIVNKILAGVGRQGDRAS